ncbi:hypothetical protein [Lentzea guizhouensis]|nr:hypothetical protein [Lentzea guizhouensis]
MTVLAEVLLASGHHDEAAELARRALDVHRETGQRDAEARALAVLERTG